MRLKTIITATLLGFVAVSVGHLAGQELGLWGRPGRAGSGPAAEQAASLLPDRVTVYYLHEARRCDTCLRTESMALELLRRDFAAAMDAGKLEWRPLVIEDNAEMAKRYGVASSAVVVAAIRGGQEQAFTRLDDLWKFLDEPARFDARVGEAIRRHWPGEAP